MLYLAIHFYYINSFIHSVVHSFDHDSEQILKYIYVMYSIGLLQLHI